jgi:hypothetical protein
MIRKVHSFNPALDNQTSLAVVSMAVAYNIHFDSPVEDGGFPRSSFPTGNLPV